VLTDGELPGGAAGTDVLAMPGRTTWCPWMGRRLTGACTRACMAATQARLAGVKPTPTEAKQGKERGGFAGYRRTRCSHNGGGEGGGSVAGHAGCGGALVEGGEEAVKSASLP
jgi:hypothetical protein